MFHSRELFTTRIGHFVRSVWPGGGTYGIRLNHIQPWNTDAEWRRLLKAVRTHSLVDEVRLHLLGQCAVTCRNLPGEFAEVGVYKGGTARLLAETLRGVNKTLHLFDTFGGMPATDDIHDIHRAGDFAQTSLTAVKSYLADFSRVEFHPGLFPQTADAVTGCRFAMVHIDVDIHRSVQDCCEFFYERMNPGAMMVFDDYGVTSCPGAKVAVDDFFRDKPEKPLYLPTAQALAIKR
jgi:O-methyltransferase